MKTILYFGNFDPNFSRNKVYIEGFKQNGINVLIVTDQSKGLAKYWNLFKAHWKVRNDYDAMIVAYTCYTIVPFARMITRKPIIFDALCSFYETQIISRDAYKGNPFRVPFVRAIDWLATRAADFILVETEKQKQYFIDELGVRANKLITVYTGLDDSSFYYDSNVKKSSRFTVLFRGRITVEAGVEHVLRAAKLLENQDVDFLIIGFGWGKAMKDFNSLMNELKLTNLRYIGRQLPVDELRSAMLECHVSLGQFADNERLKRTIPHKAFESLAMRLPYVSARAEGIAEILIDNETCLFVNPADPADLASKILALKNDATLATRLAENGRRLYEGRFTPIKVTKPIIDLINWSGLDVVYPDIAISE